MIRIKGTMAKQNIFINSCGFSLCKMGSLSSKPDPHTILTDYIGPPDEKSNLRPYVRCIPKNETKLQKSFRLKRLEVEAWNQKFWSNHNERFYEEKQEFIRLYQKNNFGELSADDMSIFYKHFLDRNRRIHILYNMSWYIKNFELLMLALKVHMERIKQRIESLF